MYLPFTFRKWERETHTAKVSGRKNIYNRILRRKCLDTNDDVIIYKDNKLRKEDTDKEYMTVIK
jgi:hypothetical protein